MNEKENGAMIASSESVEAIKMFLCDFWSLPELYEQMARAMSEVLWLSKKFKGGELDEVTVMLNQHMMILDLLKPFEAMKNEGVVPGEDEMGVMDDEDYDASK